METLPGSYGSGLTGSETVNALQESKLVNPVPHKSGLLMY